MMLFFYKMTVAENDFVMVDNRDFSLSGVLTGTNVADICQRRFGVGADGLVAVEPARNGGDILMRHYNADGSEAALEANALLCCTAFADFLEDEGQKKTLIETPAGMVQGVVNDDDSVSVLLPGGSEAVAGQALIVFRGEVILCED